MKHVARLLGTAAAVLVLVFVGYLVWQHQASKAYHHDLCVTLGNLEPDCGQPWIDSLPPRVVLKALCDQGNEIMCEYLDI